MLSILCVGRVIFIHYFYCFLLLLLAQRREPDVIDFVCWSCNIHPLFLLFFITFVSPEKGARCYRFCVLVV